MNIVTFAEKIVKKSVEKEISDLYLLPFENTIQIYFRKNHHRWLEKELPLNFGQGLIRHFKFLAGMDLAEKRKPQLGAFSLEKYPDIRMRLSSVGDYLGRESLVIRFYLTMENQLTYPFLNIYTITKKIQRRGLHLFVGPTGSGKTTFMYHLARQPTLFSQVMTIEDPVEIEEPTFIQLQTNEQIGLDYEALIKLCLRHRPDCLMIGEIRDAKTAQMVLRAALTGHVVFATLHASDEKEVYQRLEELGVAKNQLQSVLKSLFFQRLLPLLDDSQGCLVASYPEETLKEVLKKAYECKILSKEVYEKESL